VGTKGPAAWKAGDNVEVVARLTFGDEVVIDEVDGGEVVARSVIVDAEGSVVGFFRTWTTQEDIWTSARGAFAIYLAGPKGVFRRSGEVKCKKVAREGKPMVAFANARWRGDTRELEVNVRSSCESVDFFGSAEQRRSLTLSILGYTGKVWPQTEEEGRILVGFSDDGEIVAADVLRGSSEEMRAIRTCEAEGRKGSPFRVCGLNRDGEVTAYWSYGGRRCSTGSPARPTRARSRWVPPIARTGVTASRTQEPVDALLGKALLPAPHARLRFARRPADRLDGLAVRTGQHDPSPPDHLRGRKCDPQTGSQAEPAHQSSMRCPFSWAELARFARPWESNIRDGTLR
jgi:hypothetical protein